ncbi:MAG: hypothetical protein J0H74_32220 [Chitinophagaceae bacterium]|nr:hypothetical protein [Chitinophagaceae bacterium]
MKTPSLLNLVFCCLLLLGACHSHPSSASKRQAAGDSSSIDSPPAAVIPTANPPLGARDSTPEAPKESYDTLDPATRSHFRDVLAFLEFIKKPNSDHNVGFNEWIKSFRIGNIDSFLHFITIDSLEIDNADADPGKDSLKYSRTMLRQQLTGRKGAAFDMIGEISLHYSTPYPQYSHTSFSINKMDSIPNLNVTFSEFILYFRAEKGSATYKLYRLESDHISDL